MERNDLSVWLIGNGDFTALSDQFDFHDIHSDCEEKARSVFETLKEKAENDRVQGAYLQLLFDEELRDLSIDQVTSYFWTRDYWFLERGKKQMDLDLEQGVNRFSSLLEHFNWMHGAYKENGADTRHLNKVRAEVLKTLHLFFSTREGRTLVLEFLTGNSYFPWMERTSCSIPHPFVAGDLVDTPMKILMCRLHFLFRSYSSGNFNHALIAIKNAIAPDARFKHDDNGRRAMHELVSDYNVDFLKRSFAFELKLRQKDGQMQVHEQPKPKETSGLKTLLKKIGEVFPSALGSPEGDRYFEESDTLNRLLLYSGDDLLSFIINFFTYAHLYGIEHAIKAFKHVFPLQSKQSSKKPPKLP